MPYLDELLSPYKNPTKCQPTAPQFTHFCNNESSKGVIRCIFAVESALDRGQHDVGSRRQALYKE